MGSLPGCMFKEFSPLFVLKELIARIHMGDNRFRRPLLEAKLGNQLDGQPVLLNFQIYDLQHVCYMYGLNSDFTIR